jgi:catechol 2,3-dioxygenase-like lactoylglutathione lyase family enzyme
MIKQLAHICIGATDLAHSERFYVELLGLRKAFDFIRGGRQIGFYAHAGEGAFLEVFAQDEAPNLGRPLLKHFCLEVEDIDAAIAKLEGAAVEVSPKKWGADRAWQAWITDPSGVRIELMQYTPDSSQFSGEPVVLD